MRAWTEDHVTLLPEQRRRRIIEVLAAEQAADVTSLAGTFEVSPATIRRDLQQLERSGLVTRTHGGAVTSESKAFEPLYAEKAHEQAREKEAIAARAAQIVEDGDVIVLDSGSTTLALAKHLKQHRDLTVIATDLKIAIELADVPTFNVIVVGGQVRPGLYSLVGSTAEHVMAQFHANHAFIGADAIDLQMGISNASMLEVNIKRQVIASASNVVLVADHSKFERTSLVKVADLAAFDTIVTDADIDPTTAQRYTDRDHDLVLAEMERPIP